MLSKIRKNVSNCIGWSTKRKLVVLESDDWGSIRTRSKADYDAMLSQKIAIDHSNFTRNDCLESNTDLERLFDVLSQNKDSKGANAVFTPMSVVANPNFERIENSNFEQYYYEPFTETCLRYPNHNRVHALWLEGIANKLFVPQFHGREHLNPQRWMRGLKANDIGLQILFKHQSIGATRYNNLPISEHLAAFDPESETDIPYYSSVISTGLSLFEELCGYKAQYFVASNSPEPKSLEKDLKENGIEYLTRYKLQKYPLGDNKYEKEINWVGKKNQLGQIIMTRNCGFEPSDTSKMDWVNSCLADIKNAFYWNKPAVISTHRVNYISGIFESNGTKGLQELDKLLKLIKKNWPEVEFITSEELGNIIKKSKSA